MKLPERGFNHNVVCKLECAGVISYILLFAADSYFKHRQAIARFRFCFQGNLSVFIITFSIVVPVVDFYLAVSILSVRKSSTAVIIKRYRVLTFCKRCGGQQRQHKAEDQRRCQ